MSAAPPLAAPTEFPPLSRERLQALQVNLGYRCNQACTHCHVNAGPKRREQMSRATVRTVLRYVDAAGIDTLDITGGAPEMNPSFRFLVREARERGLRVIDRCNLTILEEPGYEDLAEFLAAHGVEVIASLPCYLGENVDRQRGNGVYAASVRALRRLNRLGYGAAEGGLTLDLVYNPQGAVLPPPQSELVRDYKRELWLRHGIVFNRLLTITNMPIGRFARSLANRGRYEEYMRLLREAYRSDNLGAVMCRSLLSVDWRGYVYDCDFNQMLDLPLRVNGRQRTHLEELLAVDLTGHPIVVRDHCFACTAGQGSSCGGALG